MYMNRRARMSTLDRVVELAVRNSVRVPRARGVGRGRARADRSPPASPEADAMFAAMAATVAATTAC